MGSSKRDAIMVFSDSSMDSSFDGSTDDSVSSFEQTSWFKGEKMKMISIDWMNKLEICDRSIYLSSSVVELHQDLRTLVSMTLMSNACMATTCGWMKIR